MYQHQEMLSIVILAARRYIWFGLRLTNLAWWGACSYTLGVALYLGAAIATIINDCPDTLLAPNVYVRVPSLHSRFLRNEPDARAKGCRNSS